MEEEKKFIVLGSYPQNRESMEKEPIEWVVLKEDNNGFLCISKYLLDCQRYHESFQEVTWATCTLREWLNHDFFEAAFTEEEQKRILLTDVKTPLHDTKDYLFILSPDEAREYLTSDERAAKTTTYARNRGAWFMNAGGEGDTANAGDGAKASDAAKAGNAGNGSWWLRYYDLLEQEMEEYGESELFICPGCVAYNGDIEGSADGVTAADCCVRPVLGIKKQGSEK